MGDEVPWVGLDLGCERLDLVAAGVGADQHSIASGFRDGLDHEFPEMGQDIGLILGPGAEIGGDVLNDRLFAEVIAHHVGDIGVDQLVVGNAGAGGIGNGDTSLGVNLHQAANAQHRIATEDGGIEEVVIDAPIDHIDRFQSTRCPHPDPAVFTGQIPSFHQRNAHLLGEIAVLEIGTVENPWGEQDHPRCLRPRRQFPQGFQEL